MVNWADADCHYGDHWFGPGGVNCSHCGYVNTGYLQYKGLVGRVMKKTGLSFDEAERLMIERKIARALVSGRLSDRIGLRDFETEDGIVVR